MSFLLTISILILILLFLWISFYIWNHYINIAICKSDAKLVGKTAIVTGANSGIGLEVTRELYRRGARVIMACRDQKRAEKAAEHIISTTISKSSDCELGKLAVYVVDLASLNSVRKFCKQIKENESRVNFLVNNAGIYNHPPQCTKEDDLEIHMSANHFGHFLLTNLLMDTLKSSGPSRVVAVGSYLYSRGRIDFETLRKGWANPNSHRAYVNSKLANALFVRYFNLKYGPESGVSIYYADPWIVLTNIDRYTISGFTQGFVHVVLSAFFKFPPEGCQTIVHCLLSEDIESGFSYSECQKQDWKGDVLDDGIAKKFWEKSEDLTDIHPN